MIPRVDEVLGDFIGYPVGGYDDVVVRMMAPLDIPELRKISPSDVKNPFDFLVYSTLVAEQQGRILGYTQYYVTVDGVLHSLAIRIIPESKGQGVGSMLMDVKEAIAIKAGAKTHLYIIATEGEEALKKIVTKMGMHKCQKHGAVEFWVRSMETV